MSNGNDYAVHRATGPPWVKVLPIRVFEDAVHLLGQVALQRVEDDPSLTTGEVLLELAKQRAAAGSPGFTSERDRTPGGFPRPDRGSVSGM